MYITGRKQKIKRRVKEIYIIKRVVVSFQRFKDENKT